MTLGLEPGIVEPLPLWKCCDDLEHSWAMLDFVQIPERGRDARLLYTSPVAGAPGRFLPLLLGFQVAHILQAVCLACG